MTGAGVADFFARAAAAGISGMSGVDSRVSVFTSSAGAGGERFGAARMGDGERCRPGEKTVGWSLGFAEDASAGGGGDVAVGFDLPAPILREVFVVEV